MASTDGRLPGQSNDIDNLSQRFALADSEAAIEAIPAQLRRDRMVCLDKAGARLWMFNATSALAASEGVLEPDDSPAAGRWEALYNLQVGTDTLVAGTQTITGVRLTATSRIFLTMNSPGGTITDFAALDAPQANRTVGGAGSFVVNAIDHAKNTLVTATPSFDWMIVG